MTSTSTGAVMGRPLTGPGCQPDPSDVLLQACGASPGHCPAAAQGPPIVRGVLPQKRAVKSAQRLLASQVPTMSVTHISYVSC